jgi:hypothetical protein
MFHLHFPHSEPLKFGEISCLSENVIKALEPWLTQERICRINEVIENRTYTILPVLDDFMI